MKMSSASIVAVLLFATAWLWMVSCTTAETGFIAGDLCTIEGVTVCDADGMVILQCADGVWQPLEDCIDGCTEESGIAECIGQTPIDQDTGDADKPSLPEDDTTVADDTTVIPDDLLTDEQPESTDTAVDTDTVETDELVTDEDTVIVDETTDTDALITDEATDEDALLTDEATDADTAPACTSVALNGTILYNGDYDGDGTPDNMFYTDYTPNTGNAAQDDEFMFWVGTGEPDVWHTLGTGNNANLSTCDQCLLLKEDWNGTAFAKFYFASGGEVLETVDATVTVTIKDAEFIEVTIGANDVTTVVPGGDCITMPGTHEFDLDL